MLLTTTVAIIGGGIQACALGAYLRRHTDVTDITLIDPEPLLGTWSRHMEKQKLSLLRTPWSAHISPENDPEVLLRHAHGGRGFERALVTEPARAGAFTAHAHAVCAQYALEKARVPGWVTGLTKSDAGFLLTIATCTGVKRMLAHAVVVATGLGRPWMPSGGPTSGSVIHADQVDLDAHRAQMRDLATCVVGSGLTAGTLAAAFADAGATVELTARSALTVSQLEADPSWRPGERLARMFDTLKGFDERARQVRAARVGHGVTPDVWERIGKQVGRKRLTIREGVDVSCWELTEDGKVRIPGGGAAMDLVVFATGYRTSLDALPFLAELTALLPETGGMPHLTSAFEAISIPNLFFMGRLGELVGGPLSRNIPGARRAAKAIGDTLDTRF